MKRITTLFLLILGTLNALYVPIYAQNEVESILDGTPFYDTATCSSQTSGSGGSNGIYVIGDSLTVGMNNPVLGDQNLSTRLTEAGWSPTINAIGCRPVFYPNNPSQSVEAAAGACAAGAVTVTSAFREFEDDRTIISQVGAVLIGLGTNSPEESVAQFKQKAGEYIDLIRTANATIGNNIYWVNVHLANGGLRERSTALSEIALEKGIQIIDYRSAATANPTIYSYPSYDITHNDNNGYINKVSLITSALGSPSVSSPISGSYNPVALDYPDFPNEAEIASGIEATIRRRSPSSPWLNIPNIGRRFIEEGKQHNVNPLFILASGNVESNLGVSDVARAHNNSFGRTSSGTGYRDFPSFEVDLFGDGTGNQEGFFRNIARNLYEGGASGAHSTVQDIYQYFSVHQTGQIHYPGDGMYYEDDHTDPPTVISWDSQYNPMVYYEINIGVVNEATGLSIPSDSPPTPGSGSFAGDNTCESSGSLPAGVGGYDLPGGANPMIYYSQLSSGSDNAVTGYFGNESYGSGSINDCGCGPTAMASIVSTLTPRQINPKQMADWAVENGFQLADCGSSLFWTNEITQTEYGISVSELAGPEQIAQSLQSGNLVLLYVNAFPLPTSTGTQGHYSIVRKIENGQFYFADSFSEGWADVDDVSRRAYSADEIASMMVTAWGISAQ